MEIRLSPIHEVIARSATPHWLAENTPHKLALIFSLLGSLTLPKIPTNAKIPFRWLKCNRLARICQMKSLLNIEIKTSHRSSSCSTPYTPIPAFLLKFCQLIENRSEGDFCTGVAATFSIQD